MSTSADARVTPALVPGDGQPRRPRWRAPLTVALVVLAAIGLFVAYRRMAWSWPINADGASNALQAWDLWHGNPLLHGWTLSDVSFYSTELVQYALVEVVVGVRPEVVHAAAALSYTLLVLVTAALAKGRATGWAGAMRAGVALAVMLVPAPGVAYQILLGSPDHTGSGVPMVLTWLVLDRALTGERRPRWWLPVVIAVLLAWGEMGDPLVTFVAAVPLVLVSALRLLRDDAPWARRWRGLDAQLIAAGIGSVVLGHGALKVIHAIGGFHAPSPPIKLSPLADLPHRAEMTVKMIGVLFGVYRPGTPLTPTVVGLGVLHALGLALVAVAVVVVVRRGVRERADGSEVVNQILVLAILVNLGAELVSTLSVDILAGREIAPVVPLGAALAGRICADWLGPVSRSAVEARRGPGGDPARRRIVRIPVLYPDGPATPPVVAWVRRGRSQTSRQALSAWRLAPVLAAVLALLVVALVAATPARAQPSENQDLADWLDQRGLNYGLASYWNSTNITVTTERRVTVVPIAGGPQIAPFCWQTRADWYDRTKHDARFLVVDENRTMFDPAGIIRTFGAPTATEVVGQRKVLLYDHNLLDDLPPPC